LHPHSGDCVVIERIFAHAHASPGKTAIFYCGHKISYEDFAFRIASVGQFLAEQDVPPAGVAALDVMSLPDSWIFDLALRSLGLTTVAVPSLSVLKRIGLRNIACAVTLRCDHPAQAVPGCTIDKLIQIPNQLYVNMPAQGVPALPRTRGPAGAHILVTSGTTGLPKKIRIDDACLAASLPRRRRMFGISEDSVINVFDFTLWTSLGYNTPLCAWSAGASVVLHDGPLVLHRSLDVDRITHAFLSPATLSDVLKVPADQIRRHEEMRLFVAGGPLPSALAAAAGAALTPHINTYIGSTEVGVWALTQIERLEDVRSHWIHPSVTVQIVDQLDRPLPTGQTGAVRIRAMDGVTGYLDDEEASRAFFRQGYFYSGDLGAFQADGRLVLQGRLTNVINVLGEKRAVEPIELELQDKFAAEGVCIFSVPLEGLDEELQIVIQSGLPISEAELGSFIRAQLPNACFRVHFVNDLPRNDMGKIDRAALRNLISCKLPTQLGERRF
jgi:acyl-coenzyme A synthetase/AMP-(fatty) acid ligase